MKSNQESNKVVPEGAYRLFKIVMETKKISYLRLHEKANMDDDEFNIALEFLLSKDMIREKPIAYFRVNL